VNLYLLQVNVLVAIAILLPLIAVYLVLKLGYLAAVRFVQMAPAQLSDSKLFRRQGYATKLRCPIRGQMMQLAIDRAIQSRTITQC
jgi:hypothetical protein